MRDICRDIFLRDEEGLIIIWALLFIPVFLFATGYILQHTQSVTGADVDLQGAINSAVKAASGMVTDDSQAAGEPRINTSLAHIIFKNELVKNLGLDESTLEPLSGSMLTEKPEYTLIIYNGNNDYSSSGAIGAYMYEFKGGNLIESVLPANGFPQSFGLTSSGIVYGSGEVNVRLDNPGAVAVIKVKEVKLFGTGEEIELARWGCARVVY